MYRNTCKILLIISTIGIVFGFPDVDLEICKGRKDDEKIALHESCTHYYHCDAEYGYLIDCSEYGIYRFDAELGQCNFADKVACADFDRSKAPSIHVPLRGQPLEIDNRVSIHAPEYDTKICKNYQNNVTLGVRGSCTLYYKCIDEVGYLEDCRIYGYSQYDPRIGKCSLKRKVMCDDSNEIVRSPFNY